MAFTREIKVFDSGDAVTGWAVADTDTTGLAVTDNRVRGDKALEFDKADTAANNTLAFIEKTISPAIDLEALAEAFDLISWYTYLSALTNVAYAFLRIGTDDSNFVEYRFDDSLLKVGYSHCTVKIGEHEGATGTGCDFAAIGYIAVGVAFDAETDTLSNIAVDRMGAIPSAEVRT